MKIEMGESLCASWLKHVKMCQIVQTSWKPSCFWDETALDPTRELLKGVESKLGEVLFPHKKENSGGKRDLGIDVRQVVGMTECDVVGIKFNSEGCVEKCYGMESAFHSDGLHYKSTVKKVCAKLIRAVVALKLYLGVSKIEVGFMTPKIKVKVLKEISNKLAKLREFFEESKLEVTINFYTDPPEKEHNLTHGILSFRKEIFLPLVKRVPFADDDSELFMRSVLMSELCRNNSLPVRSSLRAAIRTLSCTLDDIVEKGYNLVCKIDNANEKSALNGFLAWLKQGPLLKESNHESDFTNSARRVPDTEEVRKQTTRQKPQKGARNGLQETRSSREERS